MSIKVTIDFNQHVWESYLRERTENGSADTKMLLDAVRKSADYVVKDLEDRVQERYTVNPNYQKKNLRTKIRVINEKQVEIKFSSVGGTPLSEFEITPHGVYRSHGYRQAYLTGRVLRVSQGGILRGRNAELAFDADVYTGHIGVAHWDIFARKGRERLPIKELYGPSPVSMTAQGYLKGGDDAAQMQLAENIQKALRKTLEG